MSFMFSDDWVTNEHWIFRRRALPKQYLTDFQRGVLHMPGSNSFTDTDRLVECDGFAPLPDKFEDMMSCKIVRDTEFFPASVYSFVAVCAEEFFRYFDAGAHAEALDDMSHVVYSPGKPALGMFRVHYLRMLKKGLTKNGTTPDLWISRLDAVTGYSKYLIATEPNEENPEGPGTVLAILIGVRMLFKDLMDLAELPKNEMLLRKLIMAREARDR